MNAWLVEGASVVGESHVRKGRPNDDAIAIEQSGKWTAVVLSDGAGSAKRAREGSNLVARTFTVELLRIANFLDQVGPGPWLNDAVIGGVLEVRKELADIAGSYELKDFHCTLVAALISDRGGFTVHIGDGAIFVGRKVDEETVEYGVHSHPENGEYANETFFITEGTWLKNIRIKPLGGCEWIILTTDGASALLLDKDIKSETLELLLTSVASAGTKHIINDLLHEFVDNAYAKNCSNDDKTLAIAFKQSQTLLYSRKLKVDKELATEDFGTAQTGHLMPSNTRGITQPFPKKNPIENWVRKTDFMFGVNKNSLFFILGAIPSIIVLLTCVTLYFSKPQKELTSVISNQDFSFYMLQFQKMTSGE